MKIGITGHTRGIGKSLADLYRDKEHTVLGFSSSTGYDITDPQCRKAIVNSCADCDVFFNNAYDWESDGSCQIEMLFDIWQSWQEQQKTIVNIGSSMSGQWRINGKRYRYRTYKRALEDACELLWNQNPWPFVCVMNPCLTDTERHHANPATNKTDPNQFADLVYQMIEQKNFRVQVMKLTTRPE